MTVDLNDDERRDLENVLQSQLKSLRNELSHTDDRSYRQMVRQTLDRLENLAKKLADAKPTIGAKAS